MKKIYLASSFAFKDKTITAERKDLMERAESILEEKGFQVYNPSKLKIEDAWSYSYWDWGNLVFQEDIKQLREADLVVFMSYGKEGNSGGASFEDGVAYALNKPVIVVKMTPDVPESLMVAHSAHACIQDGLEGLLKYDFDKLPELRMDCIES